MTKRMLIDATHKEETRVAITDGNRLVEYDYESHNRKPLKGSIFLAKVTRVEPSLQAAFVNFGGNRHGFLPFSEIHPDYFRIPVADREALMAEQEALLKEHDEELALEEEELEQALVSEDGEEIPFLSVEEDEEDEVVDEPDEVGGIGHHDGEVDEDLSVQGDLAVVDDEAQDAGDLENEEDASFEESFSDEEQDGDLLDDVQDDEGDVDGNVAIAGDEGEDASSDSEDESSDNRGNTRNKRGPRGRRRSSRRAQYRNRNVEVVGGEDIDHEQRFRFNLRRKYKIQEVIKRGQIMLIQANKEERGNKGAAVGTYLSLPGRYCVLMPNSPRAGGVSRKIANPKDRARMREIVKSLDVPKGMSVIVRTAGVSRTKNEIKRDLDYLMRLWDSIRKLTLESTAPALVYEEADLIKRAVRDLYTRDVEEIYVSGDEGYKIAKNFMKMMIPSHVKKVIEYADRQLPLFNRYQIESQISEIGQPEVRLRSGGYLVINPTEALVSIDVNSGKATKGRHIEETALKTNLEAADEVARQLKLRDLGGLVVIDFIDMEDRRNNAKVERRMKEALSTDRARVQVGRISSFGLMELSRQRLSPSLTEAQYEKCPMCNGIGVIPSSDAMSINVLRAIEEEGIRARAAQVIVRVNDEVALYILNHKRKKLSEIEERYNFEVLIRVDDKIPACEYRIEVSKPVSKTEGGEEEEHDREPVHSSDMEDNVQDEMEEQSEEERETSSNREGSSRRRRGARGRGRSRSRRDDNRTQEFSASDAQEQGDAGASEDNVVSQDEGEEASVEEKGDKAKRSKRRRRKPAKDKDGRNTGNDAEQSSSSMSEEKDVRDAEVEPKEEKRTHKRTQKKEEKEASVPAAAPVIEKEEKPAAPKAEPKPKAVAAEKPVRDNSAYEVVNQAPKEKKKGWWNRLVD